MGFAEHWEAKEQHRQELVPASFASSAARRRLRMALWSRILVGVAVLAAAVGVGAGGGAMVPGLVAAVAVGLVGMVLGVVSIRGLGRLERT